MTQVSPNLLLPPLQKYKSKAYKYEVQVPVLKYKIGKPWLGPSRAYSMKYKYEYSSMKVTQKGTNDTGIALTSSSLLTATIVNVIVIIIFVIVSIIIIFVIVSIIIIVITVVVIITVK